MLYLRISSRRRQTQSRHWPKVLMNKTLYGNKRQSMQDISLDYFWYPLKFLLSIYRAWHAVTADGGAVIVVLRSWQCLRAYSSSESGFLPQPALPSVQEARPLADWGLSRRVDRSWWLKLPRVLTMQWLERMALWINKYFFPLFFLLLPLNSCDLDRSELKYLTAKARPVQEVQQKCLEWICFILWVNESCVEQGLLW